MVHSKQVQVLNITSQIIVGRCVQALYQKQGRSSQFNSRQERDEWINKEVTQLETAAAVKGSSHDELEAQTQQLSSQLMDLSQVTQACLLDSAF